MATKTRNCTATTNRGTRCWNKVEPFRTAALCHVHDPDGTFRRQLAEKGFGKRKPKQNKVRTLNTKACEHTFYMREAGIQCTKCLVIWDSDERA